jgi:hypothetical protein
MVVNTNTRLVTLRDLEETVQKRMANDRPMSEAEYEHLATKDLPLQQTR